MYDHISPKKIHVHNMYVAGRLEEGKENSEGMDADAKAKWLEALRSGDYVQGNKRLKQSFKGEDCFCCLGVLCEIMPDATEVRAAFNGDERKSPAFRFKTHTSHTAIPTNWKGIPWHSMEALISLNDDGAPFTFIADIIEEWL